jgi:hypothetical protein
MREKYIRKAGAGHRLGAISDAIAVENHAVSVLEMELLGRSRREREKRENRKFERHHAILLHFDVRAQFLHEHRDVCARAATSCRQPGKLGPLSRVLIKRIMKQWKTNKIL